MRSVVPWKNPGRIQTSWIALPSRTQPKWMVPWAACTDPSSPCMVASIVQSPISQPYSDMFVARSGAGPLLCKASMNPMFDPPLVAGSRRTLPAGPWAALGENCYNGGMGMQVETLASGPGWSVREVVCSSGPRDRRFEEQHTSVCIAAVMQGSFQYRTLQGAATLAPGAILFGNHQSCFECGHDHGVGDRCLSFLFDPGYFETILSSLPGVRTAAFKVPRLPPLMSLAGVFAEARLVRSVGDPIRFEQLALDLAATATPYRCR